MRSAVLLVVLATSLVACDKAPTAHTTAAAVQSPPGSAQIAAIAALSSCSRENWAHRGVAPLSYIQGVALVYAKSVCQASRPDVLVVSAARGSSGQQSENSDALAWYQSQFSAAGMSNDASGLDTLRHLYTLLISLGMQESSGKYCVGRDRSENFSTADSAEAGLLQTSWGAHTRQSTLPGLFIHYRADPAACWLSAFQAPDIQCSEWDAKTWGTGEGAEWQRWTKECPAFAVEYGAVVMRVNGGGKGEFGPLRSHAAEVRPECDSMLSDVQKAVQSNPALCSSLE
jgi:hypothetical protein